MEIITYSDYKGYKEQLDRAIIETTQDFIVIGHLLRQARDTDILAESGYTSMGDFARHEYGLDESVTSRFINIAERYGDGSGRLKAEYSSFTYSKLGEMLTLPSEVAAIVTPDMTVKDIREIKDQVQEEEQISDVEVMIEAAEQEEPDILAEFMKNYLEERPEEFKALCETEDIAKAYDILAPQGRVTLIARVPGTGKIMISIENMDEVKAVYVRENRSEKLAFRDIDDAVSRLLESILNPPDSGDLGEVYKRLYGHELKDPAPEPRKPEKVKVTRPKPAKTHASVPKTHENVTETHESVPKAPENVPNVPESAQNDGESVQAEPENVMPEPITEENEQIATSQEDEERNITTLYDDTLRLISKMREAFEVRKWDQAIDALDPIRWKMKALKYKDQSTVDKALNKLMED